MCVGARPLPWFRLLVGVGIATSTLDTRTAYCSGQLSINLLDPSDRHGMRYISSCESQKASDKIKQAPKANVQQQKLAAVLEHFHNSRVAHNVKELEKALPSVASINGMQVKDYLSALSDENKISVEKIGSGNWYWSFPGEEKKEKEEALERAMKERDRLNDLVNEIKLRLEDAKDDRQDENANEREEATAKQTQLMDEVESLRTQLAAYAENDPVEMKRRDVELNMTRDKAEKLTDEILEMERYIQVQMGMDKESMREMKVELYDQEYCEEEAGLKETREP